MFIHFQQNSFDFSGLYLQFRNFCKPNVNAFDFANTLQHDIVEDNYSCARYK